MSSAGSYHPFPETHWSLVRRAGLADGDARRSALATLLQRYQPALRSYLRIVRRLSDDEADDLLQAFIADRLLESDLLRKADATRGRFRTFLLTSLNNFAINRLRAQRRREGLPLEETLASTVETPSAVLEAHWARTLVHEVLLAMKNECERYGRGDVWGVFEARVLAQTLHQLPPVPYEDLARRLALQSPAQAANLLVTAKRMYARILRSAIAEYEHSDEDIEAELLDLRRVLAAGSLLDDLGDDQVP